MIILNNKVEMFIEVLFPYKGNEQLSLVSVKLHYIHFQGVFSLQNAVYFIYFVSFRFVLFSISDQVFVDKSNLNCFSRAFAHLPEMSETGGMWFKLTFLMHLLIVLILLKWKHCKCNFHFIFLLILYFPNSIYVNV